MPQLCPQLSLVKSFLNPSGCENGTSLAAISCQHVDKSAATMLLQTTDCVCNSESACQSLCFESHHLLRHIIWFKFSKPKVYEGVKMILKHRKETQKRNKWLGVFKPAFLTNLQNQFQACAYTIFISCSFLTSLQFHWYIEVVKKE